MQVSLLRYTTLSILAAASSNNGAVATRTRANVATAPKSHGNCARARLSAPPDPRASFCSNSLISHQPINIVIASIASLVVAAILLFFLCIFYEIRFVGRDGDIESVECVPNGDDSSEDGSGNGDSDNFGSITATATSTGDPSSSTSAPAPLVTSTVPLPITNPPAHPPESPQSSFTTAIWWGPSLEQGKENGI